MNVAPEEVGSGASTPILLLADAGPLITLAYANALDLLFKPGWQVHIVDMVLHEVTRNLTPTSQKIDAWVQSHGLLQVPTQTFQRYQRLAASRASGVAVRKANLGELAIQEVMNDFALIDASPTAVFLFEDHRIARASFMLPESCRKVSTRAFLIFLQSKGWITSVADIERKAIAGGRNFSQIRFPQVQPIRREPRVA